jgi:hypothetical protein
VLPDCRRRRLLRRRATIPAVSQVAASPVVRLGVSSTLGQASALRPGG